MTDLAAEPFLSAVPELMDTKLGEQTTNIDSTTIGPEWVDVGPAPAPPAWYLPGGDHEDEGRSWTRQFGPEEDSYGWMVCRESIRDGRVLQRTTAYVSTTIAGEHLTAAQVRERGQALLEAADMMEAAYDRDALSGNR